jgi:hypothetical protein
MSRAIRSLFYGLLYLAAIVGLIWLFALGEMK